MAEEELSGDHMSLFVWPGDWGIPSICHNCLAVMAYCKFSSAPVGFVKLSNPWKSPNGDLPCISHKDGMTSGVSNIFNYLRKENWGADHDLSAVESADIIAFLALLEEKLEPALSQQWWSDTKTFVDFTRPLYSKILPLPLSLYLPTQMRRKNENKLAGIRPNVFTDTEWENKLYKDAKECMNLLSSKLGDQEYFCGDTPSSLDAVVFGYLAPLLKAPFPNLILQNHLKGCMNLVHLIDKIINKHFPLSEEEIETRRLQEEAAKKKQTELTEFPNKRRNMVIAGIVAVSAMVGYALTSGLVQVEVVKDDGEESPPTQPSPPDFNQFDKLFDDDEENKKHQEDQEEKENSEQ